MVFNDPFNYTRLNLKKADRSNQDSRKWKSEEGLVVILEVQNAIAYDYIGRF